MNLFLKPGRLPDGTPLKVVDPATGERLPESGAWKSENEFWRRRIRDQDVIDETPADRPEKAAPKPPLAVVEIPANWRTLHHSRRVKIAQDLDGDFVVPDGMTQSQAADALIEAELRRRGENT